MGGLPVRVKRGRKTANCAAHPVFHPPLPIRAGCWHDGAGLRRL